MNVAELALFANLEPGEIEQSLDCSRARVSEYKKNSYIFHQEDKPQRLYVILSGKVLLGQESSTGRQALAEYLTEGQSFGERDLFLEYESYDYFAQARELTRVLSISRHFFYSTCKRNCPHHHKILFNMMKIFAIEAERNSQKLSLLTCGTLEQRIALYLSKLNTSGGLVEIPVNRESLAVYLNTARPSLSRELSLMQKKGVLRITDRRHIQILNYDLLQELIESVAE